MADETAWPAHVRRIQAQDLRSFGVGADNLLYLDGKPVAVQRKITLTTLQKWIAFGVGVVTILATVPAGIVSAWDLGCRMGEWTKGCTH